MDAKDRNILVTIRFFDDEARAVLENAGCNVVVREPQGQNDGTFSPAQLIDMLAGMQGWIVGHAWASREVLEGAPSLKVIARRGVGYERVDVTAAKELGKVVTIAAGGNAPSVADQTIGIMLAVGRRLREMQARMEQGDWTILLGTELYRRTVGLVGFGRIARQVARRLAGFEAEVLVYSPRPDYEAEAEYGVRYVDLPTLLREADYVSLHAPLNEATRHLIDAPALAAMKPTAIIINTARGGLVDEAALLDALREKRILGAGLDVFEGESDPALRPLVAELARLPNVVATPHSAASTGEALTRSNLLAARSAMAVLDGGVPAPDCVVVDGRMPTLAGAR